MLTSPEAVLAILGMALVTMAIRMSGFLLADRLPRDGFAAAWLRHIPGAVLAALVAPAVVTGGVAEAIAAAATALARARTPTLAHVRSARSLTATTPTTSPTARTTA